MKGGSTVVDMSTVTEFEGKTAIVTGAGRGMGRTVAERLSAGGARLAINDVVGEWAERTAAAIKETGREAVAVPGSVTSSADVGRIGRGHP